MKASQLALCAALAVSAPQVLAQPLCVPLSPKHWDKVCNLDLQFPLNLPFVLEIPAEADHLAERGDGQAKRVLGPIGRGDSTSGVDAVDQMVTDDARQTDS